VVAGALPLLVLVLVPVPVPVPAAVVGSVAVGVVVVAGIPVQHIADRCNSSLHYTQDPFTL